MSFMNSPKAILIGRYDQDRIKGKKEARSGVIPPHWNKTKFMSGGNFYEKVGNKWYLMKEDFYDVK